MFILEYFDKNDNKWEWNSDVVGEQKLGWVGFGDQTFGDVPLGFQVF